MSQGVTGEMLVDLDDVDLSLIPVQDEADRALILQRIKESKKELKRHVSLNDSEIQIKKVDLWLRENADFLPLSPSSERRNDPKRPAKK
jgi:hypothetical protein